MRMWPAFDLGVVDRKNDALCFLCVQSRLGFQYLGQSHVLCRMLMVCVSQQPFSIIVTSQ